MSVVERYGLEGRSVISPWLTSKQVFSSGPERETEIGQIQEEGN